MVASSVQLVCNLYLRWRCNINSWLLAIASSLPAPSFHSLAMLSRQRQSSCCTCCPPPWVWQSSSVVSTSMVQPHCHRRAANCCGTVEATSCFSRQSRDPLDVEARSTLNKVANWQMWLLHWKQLVEATSEGWSTGKQYIFLFVYLQTRDLQHSKDISPHQSSEGLLKHLCSYSRVKQGSWGNIRPAVINGGQYGGRWR